jgi:hypothetical protein
VDFTKVLLLVEHYTMLLWYEVVRCRGLSKRCYGMIPCVRMGLWIIWKGTSWYEMGKWLDWKGTHGTVWVGRYLICGK